MRSIESESDISHLRRIHNDDSCRHFEDTGGPEPPPVHQAVFVLSLDLPTGNKGCRCFVARLIKETRVSTFVVVQTVGLLVNDPWGSQEQPYSGKMLSPILVD